MQRRTEHFLYSVAKHFKECVHYCVAKSNVFERRSTMEYSKNSGNTVTRAVILLYLAFFVVWCLGAAFGEALPGAEQPALWGMPVWFVVSCLASFAGAAVVLVVLVRGWLKND